jgi:hypothetical protein
MDRDDVAFPDPNEIAPHAIAFARMMFAHAELERGIIGRRHQHEGTGFWRTTRESMDGIREWTEKIIDLIIKHRGNDLPETERIKNLLNEAVDLCRQRNFLAHGTWWCFNRRTLTVKVRSGVRGGSQSYRPRTANIRCLTSRSSLISSRILRLS